MQTKSADQKKDRVEEQTAQPPPKPPDSSPTPQGRILFATIVDQAFLRGGIESATSATGPAHTTLYIKDILAGRVRALQIQENIPWDKLKDFGFKKVVYTNGLEDTLNVTFTWKVP